MALGVGSKAVLPACPGKGLGIVVAAYWVYLFDISSFLVIRRMELFSDGGADVGQWSVPIYELAHHF